MLGEKTVCGVLAVKDLDEAKKFYEETLGLEKVNEDKGGVSYKSGSGSIFVYPSDMAGTNKATAASWIVDDNDIKPLVEALKAKGVTFEHYDNLSGMTRDGDIHSMGPMKAVWFKDPAGNILNITSGEM